MAAVEEESGRIRLVDVREWRVVSKGYTRFEEGDVIFAKITPCMENGKSAVARGLEGGRAAGSTEFHVLRPGASISTDLLRYFLVQPDVRTTARMYMKGAAGQLRVSPEYLRALEFQLPPRSEQDRIVAEIETLLTDLDAAVAALKRVQANLKRYRASVLKAACEGRLVSTEAELARKERRTYETGEQLLAHILKERRAKWEADRLAKMLAAGKPPKDNDWKKKYKEAEPPDTPITPELPEGWTWASVRQVGRVQLGRQRSPQHHSGNYMRPYLRVANVFEERIDVKDVMEMNFTPAEFETFQLKYGDILLNEGQSLELIGRPAMYRDEFPGACFQNTLVRFQAIEGLEPSYALWVFLAYMHSKRFQKIAKWTTNIAHLGADRFASLEFPLPPVAEQRRIVAKLEESLSKFPVLSTEIKRNLKRADRLRQSILKRAFEGKLVPQDPNDEPASVLLERIRAERDATANNNPKTNGQRKVRRASAAGGAK
jgi:type I restriction enzyme S subunit